jgi:hypothetical protein
MNVNGVTGVRSTYALTESAELEKKNSTTKESNQETVAATYEKSEGTKTNKQQDRTTIERLKAEADQRTASLRSLVEKMLLKQGEQVTEATDIWALLREGKVTVDPETAAKAASEIAEDGYWGVEQTSERLVSFAKALAGNDPSKAEAMMNAVKKGFKEATKAWGGELPEICQKTLDTTIEKLNKWKDGLE